MEKQYSPTKKDNKMKNKEKANIVTQEKKLAEVKPVIEEKIEKVEEKTKVKLKQEVVLKENAIVNGFSARISPKHSKYICKAIRGMKIEEAINFLEQVILRKKAIPMKGAEIPHRKGEGMMSGRYPLNASKEFVHLLGQLKANAQVNSIDNPVITLAIANKAQLPFKKEGRRGKRTHIHIEVKEKTKLMLKKK